MDKIPIRDRTYEAVYMAGYYTEQDLWFSALYGGAVYQQTGETEERLAPIPAAPSGESETGGRHGIAGLFRRIGTAAKPQPDSGVSRGTAPGLSILSPSGTSPILTNLATGEQVYLRRLPVGTDRGEYRRRILTPPPADLALWPVDLLPLSAAQRRACTLRADHVYVPQSGEDSDGGTEAHTDRENGVEGKTGTDKEADTNGKANTGEEPGRSRKTGPDGQARTDGKAGTDRGTGAEALAAAFPLSVFDGLLSGQEALDRLGTLSWKNPAVRSLAVRLTEALDRLNREGWLYHDLHPSRLFFRADGQAFFDYSVLTAPVSGGAGWYRPESYPVEFADPAVVRGLLPRPDSRSQNYSLCALLFYLFFGRCPCDGALLAGYPDDDLHNHYVKFRDYHKMPLFLFDPEDSQNAPGAFAEDDALTALWTGCPETLRRLLTEALCRRSAERRGGQVPAPGDLLACFRQLGWERGKR